MKILGIETSCDETALSLLQANENSQKLDFEVLGTELYSQIELHKEYGGVFPSLAKREHSKNLIPLLVSLLNKTEAENTDRESKQQNLTKGQIETLTEIFSREPELLKLFLEYIPKIKKPEIEMIAVTYGPGLEPALWVGINFARALSYIWQIPVMPTNHMEGHIASVLKNNQLEVEFPMISLLISGGHTELVLVKNWGDYKIIGKTLDDAVGEAFDKVARLLDLSYPGGPEISKLAEISRGGLEALPIDLNNVKVANGIEIKLPRPMLKSPDYNFSFSGIKTAALYLVKKIKGSSQNEKSKAIPHGGKLKEGPRGEELTTETKQMIAQEFEDAVTEVLIEKTLRAATEHNAKRIIIGGGVIANKYIRYNFIKQSHVPVSVPELELTTDNAVMIAMAGYLKSLRESPEIFPEIKAEGNLSFINLV